MDKIKNGAEEIYLAPETETSEDKGEDKGGTKTRGDGTLVSCPNQFSPHFINSRSAFADRCGSSTGTIKLLTERPMCERDCTIRQHPLYFLLTFWLKLGKE